jgi:hypothetical protein
LEGFEYRLVQSAGYWFGNSIGNKPGEGFYSLAAQGGKWDCSMQPNRSACMSFEKWIGRKPFILNGERLAIESEIRIGDKRFFVTSFSDDSIRISGYYSETNPHGYKDGKPTKRASLTHDDIKAIEKGTFQLK